MNTMLIQQVKAYFLQCMADAQVDHAYLFVGQDDESRASFFEWLYSQLGDAHIMKVTPIKKSEQGSAYISIDAIRDVIKELTYTTTDGVRRWITVHDAHTMNEEASNALLKILEEPPTRTHFLLTAPHERTVLPTVASRCGIIRLPAKAAGRKAGGTQRYEKFLSLSSGEQLAALQTEDFFDPKAFESVVHSLVMGGSFESAQRWYRGLRAYYHAHATLGDSFARDIFVLS